MFCNKCGAQMVDGANFCMSCGQPAVQTAPETQPVVQPVAQAPEAQPVVQPVAQTPEAQPVAQTPAKKNNFLLGVIGALLGAVVGGAVIVILGQIGVVAVISGIALLLCVLFGYSKLGGELTKPGMIACILIMLVTPYLADRVDWAIYFLRWNIANNFFEAFADVHKYFEMGLLDMSEYTSNLVMLYVFVGIGIIGMIASAAKKRK